MVWQHIMQIINMHPSYYSVWSLTLKYWAWPNMWFMVYQAAESQHENICKSLEFKKNKNPCEFHILQMLLFIPNINACIPQDRPSATCAKNSIHKCAYLLCTITNCKRHDGEAEENITFFEVCKWILVRQKGLINIYQGSRVTQFLCTTCVCQYCSLFGWPWRGGDARVIAEVCVRVFRVPILNFLA